MGNSSLAFWYVIVNLPCTLVWLLVLLQKYETLSYFGNYVKHANI